jgi:NADPH:quinone reductase-like Zn-dependent oxidoreductase
MKAIIQQEANGKLVVKDIEKPKPEKGEVLVKILASPINPSDLSLLEGSFGEKREYPIIPGIEASGIVVEAGSGLLPKMRLNKKVSCVTSGKGGTWAEYMITDAKKCIVIDDKTDDFQAASFIVNPLTALAFIDIAKKNNHTAIVNNAAASNLGKMLINLANKNSIEIINIVRRDEQIESLKKYGAKYILNSSEADFPEKLKVLSHQLGAKLFFDAIGGKLTKTLLNAAPNGSEIIVYAKLEKDDIEINPVDIIQKEKKISGFLLSNYTSKKNIFKTLMDIRKVKKMLGSEISTNVNKTFNIEECNSAVSYYQSNMSKGKVYFELK